MARYPKARWRPVVDKGNDPPIIPVGVILHVSGGESTSLFEYFDGLSGGIESQMHLNRACEWEQYRDTTQEADANYRGNSWIGPDGRRYGFISVETQGGARGQWSPPMLAEIKDFLRWASAEHGFPLRRCPTVQPNSPAEGGVGYHVMFGAGAGTHSWSNAAGKVCPGPDRIRQFDNDLVPWMGATGEDHMSTEELQVLRGDIAFIRDQIRGDIGLVRDQIRGDITGVPAAVLSHRVPDPANPDRTYTVADWLRYANLKADRAAAGVDDLAAALTTALADRGVPDADAIASDVAALLTVTTKEPTR